VILQELTQPAVSGWYYFWEVARVLLPALVMVPVAWWMNNKNEEFKNALARQISAYSTRDAWLHEREAKGIADIAPTIVRIGYTCQKIKFNGKLNDPLALTYFDELNAHTMEFIDKFTEHKIVFEPQTEASLEQLRNSVFRLRGTMDGLRQDPKADLPRLYDNLQQLARNAESIQNRIIQIELIFRNRLLPSQIAHPKKE
jgi:hypothetical protein